MLGLVCLSLGVLGPFDAFDFRNAYLSAAHAVVDGREPETANGVPWRRRAAVAAQLAVSGDG